jgi:hypothetical protein
MGEKKTGVTWVWLLLQFNPEVMTAVRIIIMALKMVWQQFYLLCHQMTGL